MPGVLAPAPGLTMLIVRPVPSTSLAHTSVAISGIALGDEPVAFSGLAQIGDQRPKPRAEAERAGRAFHLGDIAVDVADRDNRVTRLRQTQRHRPAEAAQPAGDDRDPLFHKAPLP